MSRFLLRLLLSVLFISCAIPLHGEEPTSFQQLLDSKQFKSRAWIAPSDNIVVGQQLELNIELATSRWFAEGTRIGRLEMDGAIVLKRNKFAVNSTVREQGLTWSTQLWTLTIYPQRQGEFSIPALKLQVAVAGVDGQSLQGEIHTDKISFTAALPAQLSVQQIEYWVSSPLFEVNEQFDQTLGALKVGDAVRRNINLQADGVAAMMLPSLSAESQTGLAAYQKPARLEDRVNRGTYRAIRRESITYVAESSGNYTLPAVDFWWWDTETSSLQKLTLPARDLVVGKAASENSGTRILALGQQHAYGIAAFIALLFLAALAYQKGWWHTAQLRLKNSQLAKERGDYIKIHKAFSRGDKASAVDLIQRWFSQNEAANERVGECQVQDWLRQSGEHKLLASYQGLVASAFADREQEFSNDDFNRLMRGLQAQRKIRAELQKQQSATQSHCAPLLNPRR